MAGTFATLETIDDVAHVIQIALTPVFLLAGIGSLLNVFNTRLARVSDHTERAVDAIRGGGDAIEQHRLFARLARLHRRTLALDAAIIFTAIGGAASCGAALVLFIGGVRDAEIASWLVVLFGTALGCTVAGLVAFLADSLLAWHSLHQERPAPARVTSAT